MARQLLPTPRAFWIAYMPDIATQISAALVVTAIAIIVDMWPMRWILGSRRKDLYIYTLVLLLATIAAVLMGTSLAELQ